MSKGDILSVSDHHACKHENVVLRRQVLINTTASFACICSAAWELGTALIFIGEEQPSGNGTWLTSPPGSRIQSTMCSDSDAGSVGIWNNVTDVCVASYKSIIITHGADDSRKTFATGPFTDSRYPAERKSVVCGSSPCSADHLAEELMCRAVNRLGGLSGFGTWGYQGSFSFDGQYYPDPDPVTTSNRRQAELQAAADQRQAAVNRRHLIIGLSLGLGIPVLILLCAYLLSVAAFILTWRRRFSDRQICDRVHNIIIKDPSKVQANRLLLMMRVG